MNGPLTSLSLGSRQSAFTTSQASDADASYGLAGALADNPVGFHDFTSIEADFSVEPPVVRYSWSDETSHTPATKKCMKETPLDVSKQVVLDYFNGLDFCIGKPVTVVSHCSEPRVTLSFSAPPVTNLIKYDSSITAYLEHPECEVEYNFLCSASRLDELKALLTEKAGPVTEENCTPVN